MHGISEDLRFAFAEIKGPIENMVRGFERKLRESSKAAPIDDYSFLVLRMIVLLSENRYRTILYLCDDHSEERGDNLQFVLSVPPLARTVLDSVFTIVFLFQDLKARTRFYQRAGWGKIKSELQKWEANHAGDPYWSEKIVELREYLGRIKKELSITTEEESNPKLIPIFPYPGQMKTARSDPKYILDVDRLNFLNLLDDLFYKAFSEEAHLTWPSMMVNGSMLLRSAEELQLQSDKERRENLNVLRLDHFTNTVIVFVTLMSEIELGLKYGFAEELKYVWGRLGLNSAGKKIWSFRYEGRL